MAAGLYLAALSRPGIRPSHGMAEAGGDDRLVAEYLQSELLSFVALSMFATMTFLFFRSRLDRSRLRQWAADWAVVEPVWTRKVS
jgi:hypothetical protein